MAANPWMKSLTLASSGTAYQLSALMLAADVTAPQNYAQWLEIQLDIGAGAAHLYIGNSDVSPTNRGAELVASQAWLPSSADFNNVALANIWVQASVNTTVINVVVIVH